MHCRIYVLAFLRNDGILIFVYVVACILTVHPITRLRAPCSTDELTTCYSIVVCVCVCARAPAPHSAATRTCSQHAHTWINYILDTAKEISFFYYKSKCDGVLRTRLFVHNSRLFMNNLYSRIEIEFFKRTMCD